MRPFSSRIFPFFLMLGLGLWLGITPQTARANETPLSKMKSAAVEAISTFKPEVGLTSASLKSTGDQASEVLMYALSMVGVKYKYGGNSAATGFDCSGFVNHVFSEIAAHTLPRNSEAIATQGVKVAINQLVAGDLVFFNTRSRKNSHVGIYLGNNSFVHAPSRGKGIEIVDMKIPYWEKHFNGARRLLRDAGATLSGESGAQNIETESRLPTKTLNSSSSPNNIGSQ